MTDAKFCDLHASKEGSLIRVGKDAFYNVTVTKIDRLTNPKTGKKVTWQSDARFASCHEDTMNLILGRAKALGVDPEWSPRYRLIKDENGKYKREIHPDDVGADE